MLHFDLHQLGWFSFEELCRTICRQVWRLYGLGDLPEILDDLAEAMPPYEGV